MCTGVEIAMLAATAVGTVSAVQQQKERAEMQEADAAALRDEAAAHAEKIRAAVRREKGAARAAMAASGIALDEFSEINTADIERLGASDEAMTLLSGQRRARSLEASARLSRNAAQYETIGGLVELGGKAYGAGWRGKRGSTGGVQ